MKPTTVKVSRATHDRIKSHGGRTHEATIIKALDALDEANEERFWAQAEQARRELDALAPADRARIDAEYDRIDRAYRALR
ncbi:MAG TPA: hypothetical protein VNQ73_07935 [Ilumatobacter sp.]|nr:hypothetical protein [Ilumatobacter sp.]